MQQICTSTLCDGYVRRVLWGSVELLVSVDIGEGHAFRSLVRSVALKCRINSM